MNRDKRERFYRNTLTREEEEIMKWLNICPEEVKPFMKSLKKLSEELKAMGSLKFYSFPCIQGNKLREIEVEW